MKVEKTLTVSTIMPMDESDRVEKKIAIELGPEWNFDELAHFFSLWLQFGSNWDRYAAQLPNRTKQMLIALSKLHDKYLISPNATLNGLCEAMKRFYEQDVHTTNGKRMVRTITKQPRGRKRKFSNDDQGHLRKSKTLASAQIRASLNEWFYAGIDDAFFSYNEFEECLKASNLQHITKVARAEWIAVRSLMGRPRRLSNHFIAEERNKLAGYRQFVRNSHRRQSYPDYRQFPYQISQLLNPGDAVAVVHPETRTLCTGCVTAVHITEKSCTYQITLDDLTTASLECPDTCVMPLDASCFVRKIKVSSSSAKYEGTGDFRVTQIPCLNQSECMEHAKDPSCPEIVTINQRQYQHARFLATIDRLLSRKKLLLGRMQDMQEKLKQSQRVKSAFSFKQQYSWLLVNLDVTNKAVFAAMQELKKGSSELSRTLDSKGDDEPLPLDKNQFGTAISVLNDIQNACRQIVRDQIKITQLTSKAAWLPRKATIDLICKCLMIPRTARHCIERHQPILITHRILEHVTEMLRPTFESNNRLFDELCETIQVLKSVAVLSTCE